MTIATWDGWFERRCDAACGDGRALGRVGVARDGFFFVVFIARVGFGGDVARWDGCD